MAAARSVPVRQPWLPSVAILSSNQRSARAAGADPSSLKSSPPRGAHRRGADIALQSFNDALRDLQAVPGIPEPRRGGRAATVAGLDQHGRAGGVPPPVAAAVIAG